MNEYEVIEHFAKQASEYRQLMERLIPQYVYQNYVILELLPENEHKNLKILDLGCGDGILSEIILSKLPDSQVTGFDITAEMLEIYKKTISEMTTNFLTVQGDYKKDNIGTNYDVIVAGLTLHHIKNEERKIFYKKLYNSLSAEGSLISRDIIIDEDETVRKMQYKNWKQHMEKMGEDSEFWYKKHIDKDYPITLTEHFRLLKEAGFKDIGCYWRYNNFAVTKAVKK